MRKLASIQKITALHPIEGADKIEVANILGWKVIVQKGEYKTGDLVIYIEIDSVLPPRPEFEFMAKRKYLVKTIKLRGQISQGICFPLSLLTKEYNEGDDVTKELGITKYEDQLEEVQEESVKYKKWQIKIIKALYKRPKFVWPNIPHTDETRIQAVPEVLEEVRDKVCYITTKLDGQSATYWLQDGKFGIASRSIVKEIRSKHNIWSKIKNFIFKLCKIDLPKYSSNWHTVEEAFQIEKKMRGWGKLFSLKNYAIQGEIVGPKIQKNPLELDKLDFYVFNIWDIDQQKYLSFGTLKVFEEDTGLKLVPFDRFIIFKNETIEDLLEMAKGEYPNGHAREGIVIRPMQEQSSRVLKGRLSFKAINNDYLLEKSK